ncbi:MAG: hypothetical protein J6J17_03425 [Bacilli bacterium]|nr:hypothetical protein [Bacilli bacterium]
MNKIKIIRLLIITISIINLILLINMFNKLNNEKGTKIKYVTKNTTCTWDVRANKKDKFVFLGDSITEWYPIEDMYGKDIPIINSGVAGYETKDILDRMYEMVYKYNPTKVFILIGTNDLKYKENDEDIVINNIKRIIGEIQVNVPDTEIYFQSIYPVNKNLEGNATEDRNNEEINRVNKEIKEFCKINNVIYIDMYKILSDSKGDLVEKYTKDGLHLSTLGYMKVTQKLLAYMQ